MSEVPVDEVLVRDLLLAAQRCPASQPRVLVSFLLDGTCVASLAVAVGEPKTTVQESLISLAKLVGSMVDSNIDHDQALRSRLPR